MDTLVTSAVVVDVGGRGRSSIRLFKGALSLSGLTAMMHHD